MTGVTATIGGSGPEGDAIDASVEILVGSPGDDTLNGNDDRNALMVPGVATP